MSETKYDALISLTVEKVRQNRERLSWYSMSNTPSPIVLNVGKNLYFITQGQQYLYKCQGVRLECVWGKGCMMLHQQKEVSGYLNTPVQEEVPRSVRSIGDLQVLEDKKKK